MADALLQVVLRFSCSGIINVSVFCKRHHFMKDSLYG